ncbi:MAG TPA: hypothetical protein VHU87_13090 [Rhizomicrobium sp.]|jgi:hypothetical protein|nr:hypothetical protein [Rhizomicrobium sp.]
MSVPHEKRPLPANDNERRYKPLGVVVEIPPDLPIQMVEVEVFAQLLDSLPVAANDNEELPP